MGLTCDRSLTSCQSLWPLNVWGDQAARAAGTWIKVSERNTCVYAQTFGVALSCTVINLWQLRTQISQKEVRVDRWFSGCNTRNPFFPTQVWIIYSLSKLTEIHRLFVFPLSVSQVNCTDGLEIASAEVLPQTPTSDDPTPQQIQPLWQIRLGWAPRGREQEQSRSTAVWRLRGSMTSSLLSSAPCVASLASSTASLVRTIKRVQTWADVPQWKSRLFIACICWLGCSLCICTLHQIPIHL